MINITEMKIFVFNFDNYYAGKRSFKVLARTRSEAFLLLEKERKKYLDDEETTYVGEEEIELDSPKLISDY